MRDRKKAGLLRLCAHSFGYSPVLLTLMVVTCSASAISRSVSVAKFAAAV
ncbi:hypothetical protein EC990672_1072, partial [Escherichia coli 99.0672]